jgi:hypothetical protein
MPKKASVYIGRIQEAQDELVDFFDTLDENEPEDQRDIRKLKKVWNVLDDIKVNVFGFRPIEG